jgi:disulfide oxidoreductase YuzD
MTKENIIAIKILDLPGGGGCACGGLVGGPEYLAAIQQKVAELRRALEENFPEKTSVDYVDLRENLAEKGSEAGRLLVTQEYPSPLVLIENEPKFAGSILVRKIVKEVGILLGG